MEIKGIAFRGVVVSFELDYTEAERILSALNRAAIETNKAVESEVQDAEVLNEFYKMLSGAVEAAAKYGP